MRDLLLIVVLFGAALPALIHPWIGVMLWTWVSIMNPHRLSWSLFNWPVGMIAAGVTLIGLTVTRDARRWPAGPLPFLLLLFLGWMTLTTAFSLHPAEAWPLLSRVGKILFMLLVTLAVLHTRRHIEIFASVIAASLAFFGFKGGLFTLTTGGEFRVWGPPDTFIADNNELALALVMTIPLLRYFQVQANNRWVRFALLLVMATCVLAVLGSHSRGAAMAGAAMAIFLWIKSGMRPLTGLMIALIGAITIAVMPQTWETRIDSIQRYEQDLSVQGRFLAWQTAANVASERITGGGFGMWTRQTFATYNPQATSVHAAHSIYFQVLGEHGVIGLSLFLAIWLTSWVGARRLQREASRTPDAKWLADLAVMVQVSLVAYAVGGAFYSLAYFDLPYDLAAIIMLGRRWLATREQSEQTPALGNHALAHS